MNTLTTNPQTPKTMDSLTTFSEGTKCSVMIETSKGFRRVNGVVNSRINHKPGRWCVAIPFSPWFVQADERYYEIIEPMTDYEELINAIDELA